MNHTASSFMSRLTELAGQEVANKISQEFGGGLFYLPIRPDLDPDKARRICAEFDGMNHYALAELHGVSLQYVYRAVLAGSRGEAVSNIPAIPPECQNSDPQTGAELPVPPVPASEGSPPNQAPNTATAGTPDQESLTPPSEPKPDDAEPTPGQSPAPEAP